MNNLSQGLPCPLSARPGLEWGIISWDGQACPAGMAGAVQGQGIRKTMEGSSDGELSPRWAFGECLLCAQVNATVSNTDNQPFKDQGTELCHRYTRKSVQWTLTQFENTLKWDWRSYFNLNQLYVVVFNIFMDIYMSPNFHSEFCENRICFPWKERTWTGLEEDPYECANFPTSSWGRRGIKIQFYTELIVKSQIKK